MAGDVGAGPRGPRPRSPRIVLPVSRGLEDRYTNLLTRSSTNGRRLSRQPHLPSDWFSDEVGAWACRAGEYL